MIKNMIIMDMTMVMNGAMIMGRVKEMIMTVMIMEKMKSAMTIMTTITMMIAMIMDAIMTTTTAMMTDITKTEITEQHKA